MRLITLCIVILLIATIYGCSGGFDTDSDNSKNLEQSVFAPDTIVQ